jgi:iron complex outermembrane recepter protein
VTVQTVPLELIQQQNVTDIATAVNTIPGVNAFTAYGIYEYYILRGFGLEARAQTPVLLNGLRLEGNRISSQVNSVESVGVLKGPSSLALWDWICRRSHEYRTKEAPVDP